MCIATRLIDGQFPNYKQFLPESFDHAVVARQRRVPGGRTARQPAGAEERAPAPQLRSATASLTLRAVTQDVGQAEEELEIEYGGEEFEIGFNPALSYRRRRQLSTATHVTLKFINPLRPGLGERLRGRELPLPDHADPSEQLNDVAVNGPLPLGAFLKLAGAADSGGEAKVIIQARRGERERRRRDAARRTVRPGDVVAVGGEEYRVCSSQR